MSILHQRGLLPAIAAPFFSTAIASPSGCDASYALTFRLGEAPEALMKATQLLLSEYVAIQRMVVYHVRREGNGDIDEIIRQRAVRDRNLPWYSIPPISGPEGVVFTAYWRMDNLFTKFVVKREASGRRTVRQVQASATRAFYNTQRDELYVFGISECWVFDGATMAQKQRSKPVKGYTLYVSPDESGNFSVLRQMSEGTEFALLGRDLEPLIQDVAVCTAPQWVEHVTRHPSGYHLVVFYGDDSRLHLYRPDFTLAEVVDAPVPIKRLATEGSTGRVIAQMKNRDARFWAEIAIGPAFAAAETPEPAESREDAWLQGAYTATL